MASIKHHLIAVSFLACVIVLLQGFAPLPGDEQKPKNLKVLPKNISHDELINTMRMYSRSLGVHCDFCHKKIAEGNPPKMDFASDDKTEKLIARRMMKMTAAINKKYIGKMENGKLERITCVTCHMGRTTPVVSMDSLKKQ